MSMVKAYTAQVAAGAKVSNILADTELERAPAPGGHFHVFGRHAAAPAGIIQLNARVAGELKGEDLPINIGSGGPKKPDDHIITVDAAPGDPVLISITEIGGAAACDPSIRVEFEELTPAELEELRRAFTASRGGGRGRGRALGLR
jgi:hypothetical protein